MARTRQNLKETPLPPHILRNKRASRRAAKKPYARCCRSNKPRCSYYKHCRACVAIAVKHMADRLRAEITPTSVSPNAPPSEQLRRFLREFDPYYVRTRNLTYTSPVGTWIDWKAHFMSEGWMREFKYIFVAYLAGDHATAQKLIDREISGTNIDPEIDEFCGFVVRQNWHYDHAVSDDDGEEEHNRTEFGGNFHREREVADCYRDPGSAYRTVNPSTPHP